MKRISGVISLLLFFSAAAACQQSGLFVSKIKEPIRLDGRLEEPCWSAATAAHPFTLNYPTDSIPAQSLTVVKAVYNDEFLYISAICKEANRGDYIVQSLKRDFDFSENDAFELIIDAFNDATTGVVFAVNPYGVQRDGFIEDGGRKGIKDDWNGLWYAEVQRNSVDGSWSLEMAIPFKTLRFSDKFINWNVNFARNDIKTNELSVWSPVPQGFSFTNLAFCGRLIWEEAPPKPVANISLNPYLATIFDRSYGPDSPDSKIHDNVQFGVDAKIALTSSLNLDLTLNPDFSQVEVDQEIINLQRFEVAFPERRVFFQENSDLFSTLGNSRVQPFFSRRIGSFEDLIVPINFGARLSGNLNANWRLGIMSIQTKAMPQFDLSSQNYSVGIIQRKIMKRSGLSAFLINRQATTDLSSGAKDFNRVGGVEYDFRSADSRWTGKAFVHASFNPGIDNNGYSYSSKLRYKNSRFSVFAGMDVVGENYFTDVGFVPRLYHTYNDSTFQLPYVHIRTNAFYRFLQEDHSIINYWGPEVHFDWYGDVPGFGYQEHVSEYSMLLNFINTSEFKVSYTGFSVRLLSPLLLRGLDRSFPAGRYPHQHWSIGYDTGKRGRFFGNLNLRFGTAYMGHSLETKGAFNFRQSAHFVIGASYSATRLKQFPEQYGSAVFTLVGGRMEISFTRNIFFTTFLQYNTQSKNFNINSRFNWRFNSLSDIYLVYTENYLTEGLFIRDRTLVLKVNYWLNL